MILLGEHKTIKKANATLKLFMKGEKKGAYRVVKNACGAEKKKFPFLIQMKDETEESGYMCLHD